MWRRGLAVMALWGALHAWGVAQQPRSPEEFLQRPVGTDFELADWQQVRGFYRELAERSPRVELRTAGETTEGREFLVAVISSEENLGRIDEIQQDARTLADPRGKSEEELQSAVERGKVVLFITPSMHATEVAATEMGMELAWRLATSDAEPWRSARRNAVVVLTPSLNPDGVDHVVHWYREHVDTPYEGASLLKLYQYYTGHDNNRDWFMLTQAETRHLTRLMYQEWYPQFIWDVHQQGSAKERFFVPPYRDPLNPNIDPQIVAGVNLIGTRAVLDMTRQGLTGIATGVSYDNWWNGGNRSVPSRHHVIGILTEAASARFASPNFQPVDSLNDPLGTSRYQPSNQFVDPWPGGWWRVGDIIDYELAFGKSLLGSINREPRFWLANALEASQRSIAAGREGGPRGWLLTTDNADRGAARRLVDILLASGVEVRVSDEPFEADGRTYPPGTVVILRDQPYGGYVKDLFELQDFPPGSRPYDVSGWTLPLLLGVRRIEVTHDFEFQGDAVTDADQAVQGFAGDERLDDEDEGVLSAADSDGWRRLFERLEEGEAFRFVTGGERAGLMVPTEAEQNGAAEDGGDRSDADAIELPRLPRIGVYRPWSASIDEGWLRWVLDDFGIPFVPVRNETLRAGRLEEIIDVLVFPHVSPKQLDEGRAAGSIPDAYAGGIAPEGAVAVERFVRDGGTLVACGASSAWVIDQLRLPLVDVTSGSDARGFSCPGSVLRATVEPHRVTAGLPDETALFFASSAGWRPMTKSEREEASVPERRVETLLRYAPTRLLWSGYIAKPEVLAGHDAWVTTTHGDGRVHLFGFRPHYRGWSQATFPLLFRALLLRAEAGEE